MRLAIISDIHSNYEALSTADLIIKKSNIDKIICLGDIVGYGADPTKCVDYVRQNAAIVIQGNHDAAINNPIMILSFSARAAAGIRWTLSRLSPQNIEYLGSLPLTAIAYDCTFVHSDPQKPDEWRYIHRANQLKECFAAFSTSLCFFGHTHFPIIYNEQGEVLKITKVGKYMLNPGSIGQPRDGNPDLSFGILDTDEWSFEIVRSQYDIQATANKILQTELPSSLAHRLYIGI